MINYLFLTIFIFNNLFMFLLRSTQDEYVLSKQHEHVIYSESVATSFDGIYLMFLFPFVLLKIESIMNIAMSFDRVKWILLYIIIFLLHLMY